MDSFLLPVLLPGISRFMSAFRSAIGMGGANSTGLCSIFGHMKDEIKEIILSCKSFKEVQARIDDWIDYYNNDRGQWDLLKLAPSEYYEYLKTGKYPLPVYSKAAIRDSASKSEV